MHDSRTDPTGGGADGAWRFALAAGLVLLGALLRLVPHPWNVTPLGAIALFAGASFCDRRWALSVPLAALLLSDALLAIIDPARGFYVGMIFTYLGFVAVVCCGRLARRARVAAPDRPSGSWRYALAVAAAAVGGSALFFAISNFGAWLTFGDYPYTPAGLWACYVAGIPFHRPMLLGDLVYVPLLFGAFACAERLAASPAGTQAARAQTAGK